MFRLLKLKWQKRKIERHYNPDIDEALAKKDQAAFNQLLGERNLYLDPVQEKIDAWRGAKISRRAEKLDIEEPPDDKDSGYWNHDRYEGTRWLTPKGRHYLRKRVDEAHARQFERWARWLKLLAIVISALTGLVGVLIGLFSVLHHH